MIIALILCWSIYLLVLAALVWAWRAVNQNPHGPQKPSFSIIIAARNEAANLQRYLHTWLAQSYSNFELIIVLDRCDDDSKAILSSIDDPRLRIIEILETPDAWASKKWAISQGIAASQNAWLAFTDADCALPDTWLTQLAQHIKAETELILGLGPYYPYPSLLNHLQTFETSYTALQYIGFAYYGMPYMGVGRNLAYTKSFYLDHDGFSGFAERLSGDDDLLVNAYAHPKRTALMTNSQSWTWSEPEMSWGDWFRQKTRHLSASPAYSGLSKSVLGIFHLSHLLGYLLWIGGLFWYPTNLFWWSLLFIRLAIAWLLWATVKPRLDKRRLLLLYPVLDFLFFLYNLILVPIGTIRKPSWTKKQESQKIQKKTES